PAGLAFVAELLGMTSADVAGVASFYSMYRRDPTGKYLVGVCTNTLCAVMGGDTIYDELKSHLGVGNDQTTEDGTITLQHIECNAACDYAPVVMVNWEFFDNQTPESARRLVDKLREDAEVRPTRGMPLCSFAANERILAGFPDERPDDGQGGAGAATLAGLQVAREHGMTAPEPDADTRGGEK
ncbi:NADH-quinone oxidoreductase subunit NuoE, partial [Mycobacterium sp. UM_Kg1]|uniref:NADH-quinone oxidoreductase subunit NuoE n=1 Tax=Mycobacterium sp. UM_Kg1 TaxID=1545691 RepID=UPI00061B20D0